MAPIKKIDYRELAKEAPQEAPQGPPQETQQQAAPQAPPEQAQQPAAPETLAGPIKGGASNGAGGEKPSFFVSLANKWGLMDKKMKIEVVVFAVIVTSTICFIIYYFIHTTSIRPSQEPTREPPLENFEEFYLIP